MSAFIVFPSLKGFGPGQVGEGSASDEPTARTSDPQGSEFVSRRGQPEMDGALATSARNSSLDLNVFMRSMSSSRPAPPLPPPSPPDRPDSTRRSFHTMLSWFRGNSSSSCLVDDASTSMAG